MENSEYRPRPRVSPEGSHASAATRARARAARRRRRLIRGYLRLAGLVLLLLLAAGLVTFLIRVIQRAAMPPQVEEVPAVTTSILAPLPFEVNNEEVLKPRNIGPDIARTGLTPAGDSVALPECGIVETSYFSDAAFLGDSITEGLIDYDIDLSGALVCGYRGASPNQIANRTTLSHSQRGEEVPLDVLAAAQPKKLYILMGTNALGYEGGEDSFLAYYGKMLDELRKVLPDTAIYVQGLLPVTPAATEKYAGLNSPRFKEINKSIAQLAQERDMYYLDLWTVFAGEDGNLREDIAQRDGVHMTVSGYQEWVSFLCKHVKYNKSNPYLPGSDYSTT